MDIAYFRAEVARRELPELHLKGKSHKNPQTRMSACLNSVNESIKLLSGDMRGVVSFCVLVRGINKHVNSAGCRRNWKEDEIRGPAVAFGN